MASGSKKWDVKKNSKPNITDGISIQKAVNINYRELWKLTSIFYGKGSTEIWLVADNYGNQLYDMGRKMKTQKLNEIL